MASALIEGVEFPPSSRALWTARVAKVLAGASFEDSLVSSTDDGIRIDPISERRRDAALYPRIRPDMPWTMVSRVDDPDPARANAQAIEDVGSGAGGLSVFFEGAPGAHGYGLPVNEAAFARAMEGVPLERIHLRINAHPASRASADWLVGLINRRRVPNAGINVSLGIDPASVFAGTGRLRVSIEALQASMPQSLAHLFSFGIPGVLMEGDGRVFHDAGATEAQELGIVLASAVSYLRMFDEARQPLVYAAPYIGFVLAVDQDQFLSIAKLRALRRLWAEVQAACRIEPVAATIHAETSWRMTAFHDPETNIPRNTIAAFAAAAGGADSISVLPHTAAYGLPAGLARRVARNTQLILAAESHVGFVADPAAGAGAVESLTDALCEKAWGEFQRIEAEGGILVSLKAGAIQNRIRSAAMTRQAALGARQRTVVGATLYPLAKERPVDTLDARPWPASDEGVERCQPLVPVRLDDLAGATP